MAKRVVYIEVSKIVEADTDHDAEELVSNEFERRFGGELYKSGFEWETTDQTSEWEAE